VDPDQETADRGSFYNLYRLNQDFLEPELFEGPHYCTRIDANAIKNFIFHRVFRFLPQDAPTEATGFSCTLNDASLAWSII
jgi:hypothetical protein